MKASEETRLYMIEEIVEEVIRLVGKGVKEESISVDFRNKDELLGSYPHLLAIKCIAGGYWQDANVVDIDDVTEVHVRRI